MSHSTQQRIADAVKGVTDAQLPAKEAHKARLTIKQFERAQWVPGTFTSMATARGIDVSFTTPVLQPDAQPEALIGLLAEYATTVPEEA